MIPLDGAMVKSVKEAAVLRWGVRQQ